MLDNLKTALGDIEEARAARITLDARTAMLMSCSQDCVKLLNLDGTIRYMSRNGRCAMEIDDLTALLGRKWSSLWPDETREMLDRAVAEAGAGHLARFVAECPTAKGRVACWDVTVAGVPDASGDIQELISVSVLTERPVSPLVIS